MTTFNDPFEALFAIHRALDARKESDWMGSRTTGMGSFPTHQYLPAGRRFRRHRRIAGCRQERPRDRDKGKYDPNFGQEDHQLRRRRQRAQARTRVVRDGVLALFIPRAESDKPRTIKVK